MSLLLPAITVIVLFNSAYGQSADTNATACFRIDAIEARNHYGETVIVTGMVAQVNLMMQSSR